MSKMPAHVRYGHPRPSSTVAFGIMLRAYKAAVTAPSLIVPGEELAYGQVRGPIGTGMSMFLVLGRAPDGLWSVMRLTGPAQGRVVAMSRAWLACHPLVEAP